jgi:competence protein ComEC
MALVYLGIAFALGILAGHVLRSEGVLACAAPPWLFPSLAALFAVAMLLLRKVPKVPLIAAIGMFFVLGAWRYSAEPFERCWTERDLAYYQSEDGAWASVKGLVTGYPDVRDTGTRYQLAVERVVVDGQAHEVAGLAIVEARRYPVYAYGDRLQVDGLLLTPPISDDFDYRRFLATRGIYSLVRRPAIELVSSGDGQPFWRVLYATRIRGAAVIDRIMPEPAASLTNGMVLGIEGGIPAEVDAAFKATGTSHLIVISGSNIAFLAGAIVAALALFLSKPRAALVAAPLVLAYVLLVGADPPALRAGVMGLLGLGAIYFGRRGTAYVSLCAAGMAMLTLNPLTLWDIGFQLSFMTSLGLILFSRPLGSGLLAFLRLHMPIDTAKRVTRTLDGTLIVTVAAQAAVLPLLLSYFGQLSPVSLLTNCLVLPVQPAILAGGIGAMMAGAAWQPLGQMVGTVPWLLLSYTVAAVRATASLPFASVDVGRTGPVFVAGYYLLLVGAFGFHRISRLLRAHPGVRRAAAWSSLYVVPAVLAFFVWRIQPDGRLHVVFVPAEKGEAAVVVAPNGWTAWVWDGRGDGEGLEKATRAGGWVRQGPDLVLAPCDKSPWSNARCIDPNALADGAGVVLADGVRLTKVVTNRPAALLLTYGQFSTLLPSTTREGGGAVGVSVLKTAGPDTGAWPSVDFLRATQPQLVLWPLETTYPSEVSEYLETKVATVRVEVGAAVEVVSEGKRFWLVRHSSIGPR